MKNFKLILLIVFAATYQPLWGMYEKINFDAIAEAIFHQNRDEVIDEATFKNLETYIQDPNTDLECIVYIHIKDHEDELIDNAYIQDPDTNLERNVYTHLEDHNTYVRQLVYSIYGLINKRYEDLVIVNESVLLQKENSGTSSKKILAQELYRVEYLRDLIKKHLYQDARNALSAKNYDRLLACLRILDEMDEPLYQTIEEHIRQIEESSPAEIMNGSALFQIKSFINIKNLQKIDCVDLW